jgi:hypothetical protein
LVSDILKKNVVKGEKDSSGLSPEIRRIKESVIRELVHSTN